MTLGIILSYFIECKWNLGDKKFTLSPIKIDFVVYYKITIFSGKTFWLSYN